MKRAITRLGTSTRVPSNVMAGAPGGGDGADFEPYFRGANVLTDPEFENFRDNSGGWYHWDRKGGSSMFTLPFVDLTCPSYLRWPDGSCAVNLLVGWAQTSGPYGSQLLDNPSDPMWHITTFDARAIEYGAYWMRWSGAHNTLVPAELTAFSPYTPPFSCRVEPGDSIVWSGWVRVSAIAGVPQIILILRWYNSSGNLTNVTQGATTALTTTRTLYSYAQTAPPGAYYLRATYAFAGTGDYATVVVVDSATLGVT